MRNYLLVCLLLLAALAIGGYIGKNNSQNERKEIINVQPGLPKPPDRIDTTFQSHCYEDYIYECSSEEFGPV